jgi:zinc transporter
MSTDQALLHAYILDGKGRGKKLDDLAEVKRWKPIDGVLWVNLDYAVPEAATWLNDHSNIDPVMREALTDNDPRPRVTVHGDDLLVITRGINVNQGAEPEDMISIRIYVERERIITLRHRASRSLKTLVTELQQGKGPKDAPDLLVQLIDRIVDGIVHRVDTLSDAIGALEDRVLAEERPGYLRANIADHRRRAIALRRFLAPQREAFVKLSTIALPWFGDSHRDQFVESADRMTRTVEELDAARDRASVTQEELSSRLGEMTNQRLYVLSMITAVFLPLGFVCGLLGVNVGGVPFKEDDWAFWVLIGVFLVGVWIQLWIFRRRGWMER